ncbi:hypothetical protein [Heyndrickxia acidicola]|uniref:Uncharacterized protein n=1 Tax=Heyndrickxia acidicola TaxID=209389 RepID=A0ABU6MMK2_9BACI|nr:hypothetical protein [Heyndrickxia acidicola]MED1205745.1 hypothetical protein [Heyndrickxia acidicola]
MKPVPINIHLGDLKLNSADHSSAISIGTTIQIGRNVTARKNQAFGQQLADNTIQVNPYAKTIDNDLSDFFSVKKTN